MEPTIQHSHTSMPPEKNIWKSMHPYKVGFFVALGVFTVWLGVILVLLGIIALGSSGDSGSDPFNTSY
jgi:hypothetical protein